MHIGQFVTPLRYEALTMSLGKDQIPLPSFFHHKSKQVKTNKSRKLKGVFQIKPAADAGEVSANK